ncbi:helix-turn-helix transcriptional regulator [Enterobacter hormaechei]|uniref:Helix-turn-helix transcriptional regulator n=1 Tax=Enterobacter hormaechei TaxID=158836 RepID=A0A4Y5ZVB4_9ENTR|nr:helix-turn-helix transcriptional regulator [Enterobacter hormaechei]
MDEEMNFGKRLQKAIKDLEISQSELARRLGVKAQSVNGWCNSDILPRSEILNLLPAATGYPLSWFFMEDGETLEEHDPGHQNQKLSRQQNFKKDFWKHSNNCQQMMKRTNYQDNRP